MTIAAPRDAFKPDLLVALWAAGTLEDKVLQQIAPLSRADIDRAMHFTAAQKIGCGAPPDGFSPPPAGMFWSAMMGQRVTREYILSWASENRDNIEGDRFWVTPDRMIGAAKVGNSWMIVAYRDGQCTTAKGCHDEFELLITLEGAIEAVTQ